MPHPPLCPLQSYHELDNDLLNKRCAKQSYKFYHLQIRSFYFCNFFYFLPIPIPITYDKLGLYEQQTRFRAVDLSLK